MDFLLSLMIQHDIHLTFRGCQGHQRFLQSHHRNMHLIILPILILWIAVVLGNVEKTIFLGPAAVPASQQRQQLDLLRLDVLQPSRSMLRRQLKSTFPTRSDPKGTASWFLLEGLTEGQRYEVRVCWLATVRGELFS